MQRRAADLDHLEPGRAFEHAVADARGLQDAISGAHDEVRSLVLVDHPHPAGAAIDHLEADLVVVHVIGHRAALGDHDMRGDEAPAEAAGDQVAIAHAGAAGSPVGIAPRAADDQGRGEGWHDDRRIGGNQKDTRAVRRDEGAGRHLAGDREPQEARRGVRLRLQPQPDPMPGDDRRRRGVGRIDGLDAQPEPRGEELQRRREIGGGQDDLGGGDALAYRRGHQRARSGRSR